MLRCFVVQLDIGEIDQLLHTSQFFLMQQSQLSNVWNLILDIMISSKDFFQTKLYVTNGSNSIF